MNEQTVSEESGESREESGFEKFASEALRLRRKGSFESLLAQHLIISVASDPLMKVRLVCEASFMVPPGKAEVNMDQVNAIYALTQALLNTNTKTDYIYVSYPFDRTAENYERYIKPWKKQTPLSFFSDCIADTEKKTKIIQSKNSDSERFYCYSTELSLHPSSFNVMKAEFLIWAFPLVMSVFEKLARLIDPDLYREMLGVLKPEVKE